jgi:3-oxoacyl-[acyl-carrier-protein] synthase I
MTNHRWQEDGIYVLSVGAQTPVGRSALRSAAAVRCGISAYREHPFMIDRHGEPMVVAMADWIPETMLHSDRIVSMASDALSCAFQGALPTNQTKTIPLMFAMSSSRLLREDLRIAVAQKIIIELQKQGFEVRSQILAEEHAVGVLAVQHAVSWLQRGISALVAVAGVDSHLDVEHLERLDYDGKLHSTNNSWGFTPGEAAGAIVLTTGKFLNQTAAIPLARLTAVSTGSECKLLGTRTVCIGEGLTQAFRGCLSESDKVSHSYCDLNGETYRADEFSFAVCRTREGFYDAGSFTAAAECWGDVGAASVPLQVALATSAWSRGYANGSTVLCWSSSACSQMRGALRLSNSWHTPEKQLHASHD